MSHMRYRAPLKPQAPLDAGDGRAADPYVVADLLDMHAPGAAERGALTGDVARRGETGADQPLGEAGVQAAGDRILAHAGRRHEGAHLELRLAMLGHRPTIM